MFSFFSDALNMQYYIFQCQDDGKNNILLGSC